MRLVEQIEIQSLKSENYKCIISLVFFEPVGYEILIIDYFNNKFNQCAIPLVETDYSSAIKEFVKHVSEYAEHAIYMNI